MALHLHSVHMQLLLVGLPVVTEDWVLTELRGLVNIKVEHPLLTIPMEDRAVAAVLAVTRLVYFVLEGTEVMEEEGVLMAAAAEVAAMVILAIRTLEVAAA